MIKRSDRSGSDDHGEVSRSPAISRPRRPGRALLALALCLPAIVSATTVIPPTFDELVEQAELVFEGRVRAIESRWVGENETRRIKTFYTFQIDELLKGSAPSPYVLEVLGGTVGEVTLKVEGAPDFAMGDRVILFVTDNGTQFVPLVGIMYGHYKVETDAETKRDIIVSYDGSELRDTGDIGKGPTNGRLSRSKKTEAASLAITPEGFKDRIREKMKEGKH